MASKGAKGKKRKQVSWGQCTIPGPLRSRYQDRIAQAIIFLGEMPLARRREQAKV
jgi:hypothetical protein